MEDYGRVLDALLSARGPDKTICPSEIARGVANGQDWRPHMDAVHQFVEDEARSGRLVLTQKGCVVGPGRPRGAYRIRRP
jgi:hypothetical protein